MDEELMIGKMVQLLEAVDKLNAGDSESIDICRRYILLSVREDASKFTNPNYKKSVKWLIDERLNKKEN